MGAGSGSPIVPCLLLTGGTHPRVAFRLLFAEEYQMKYVVVVEDEDNTEIEGFINQLDPMVKQIKAKFKVNTEVARGPRRS